MENVVREKNAETTYYTYEQIIKNHIKPILGNIPLQDIKAMQLQKYLFEISQTKNLSAVTVKKHYTLLKTAFQLAVKQDYINVNVLDKVEPPKIEDHEIDCYNPEQMHTLFTLVKDTELELIVKLAGYLGLRRGEYCGLKWSNVDFENRCITIKETRTSAGSMIVEKGTKNRSSIRKLPIPNDLYSLLKNEKNKQEEDKKFWGNAYFDGDYVLAKNDGHPVRPNRLSEKFTKFIQDHNLPKLTLHGLRHSFASNANLMGATVFDISKTLGHSNISTTTKVYMHTFDEVQTGTVNRIAELYHKDKKGK
jgi:integrase